MYASQSQNPIWEWSVYLTKSHKIAILKSQPLILTDFYLNLLSKPFSEVVNRKGLQLKAGLIGLAKSISKEMGSRNITSNVIAPGYIETDMTSFLDEQNKENIIEQLSIKRIGKPEDISNLVSFLCKDESEYITGQVIPVDGGLTT